ncbi:MAG: aminotransferase class III-fold pyridoxal phosphate-dependent enzyme, partial [Rhizonema sp. PD38]|nr:aminotransferase class III-fold pyridoxal phosphate-dependent enzyme [Rhizonema sp. PD38]
INKTVFTIDFSKCDLEKSKTIIQKLNFRPDIFIMGEKLTNSEIPFSVFSMTDRLYKPWNTLEKSLLHSSTFGGNLLALTKVKEVLLSLKDCSHEVFKECKLIETDKEKKFFYFSKYINGKLRQFYKLTGYDIDIKEASGCYFQVEKSSGKVEKILDGVSGGGLGIFGHNPDDLEASVLSKHDFSHDYWADLSKELTSRTRFETVFPAVSGATAVEIGMSLCLVAQKQKKKMIVFQNNYAGKLLLPLVATTGYTYGGLKANPSKIFQPLYSEVVVIDVFKEGAEQQLLSEIQSGQVGLIWFEYIQGKVGKNIPDKIIDIINKYKEDFGYYIGIDEILMGLYRSGRFLSHEGKVHEPDIVTFSKGLTYLTFPIGVTLVSKAVYSQAIIREPNLVKQLEVCYKNQLAAHIACHCLERMHKENIAEHVQSQLVYLQNRLEEMRCKNSLFKEILVNGLFFGVYSKLPWWLEVILKFGGELGKGLYLVALTRCWIEEGVFVFVDTRLLPSLTLSRQEIDRFLITAQKILNKKPSSVIFKALWKYIASEI